MRIPQEALWEGMSSIDLEKQKGWEYHGYDKNSTRMMLSRIHLFVTKFEPSEEFYERYRRKEELEKEVPEILDFE